MGEVVKIGTRGSALALWQAREVQARLQDNWPELDFDIVVIKTSGDWVPADGEVALARDAGGKAQFAKEIQEALLDGRIDMAVHSMKDMDSVLPEMLEIVCMLPREDARDALLLRDRGAVGDLEGLIGLTVGTVSVRRCAALAALGIANEFVPLRGNVETRLSKLRGDLAVEHPKLEATMLAVAGLRRLGLEAEIDCVIELAQMLPAAAQGAIGVEVLADDSQLRALLLPLNCSQTQMAVEAERGVLKALEGSCHTPIGVYAVFEAGDELWLRACLYMPDGSRRFEDSVRGTVKSVADAVMLGVGLGERLKLVVPEEVLEQIL